MFTTYLGFAIGSFPLGSSSPRRVGDYLVEVQVIIFVFAERSNVRRGRTEMNDP